MCTTICINKRCRRLALQGFPRIQFFHRGHKLRCFLLCNSIGSTCHVSPLCNLYWLQPNLHHMPISCFFTFQILHFPCCNLNASKSLPATSLFGCGKQTMIIAIVPLKGNLPPLLSLVTRRVSFLSRITDAFSMAYIMRKKPDLCSDCCSVQVVRCQIVNASTVPSIHIEQTSNVRGD